MFGGGGFGGFGASSAPAFGGGGFGQPSFGAPASTPAFGAPSSAPSFGASAGFGAPSFGAPSTPAFGAPASTPAFGAPLSAPAFGSSVFGTPSSAPAFGSAAPAFGSASPASSPFGSSLFGGASTGSAFGAPTSSPAFGAFGAPKPPAFGAVPASPFGTPAPPAGGGLFGAPAAAPAPFGAPSPAVGGAPGTGTRAAPFTKTVEKDGTGATGTNTMANYMSITAMPQYVNKSVEELRWEDYQANVKNASSAPPPQPFGQPAASNPFAPAPASPSPFGGGTSLFGATSSPTSSPFGLSTSTPAFGASAAPAASPPFGAGASLFGASQSTPAFGAPSPTPAFGAGGAFGAPSSAPAFGSSAFGTLGASSPLGASTGGSLLGSSAPAFGSQPPTSPAPFSFGSAPAFGAQQPATTSAPAFGATPSLFGTPPPSTGGGLFGTSSAPSSNPFGAASSPAPAFGASSSAFGGFGNAFARPAGASAPFGASSGSSLFGSSAAPSAFGSSAPSFGGGFGGFGGFGVSAAPPASSAPAFGGGSSPSLFGTTSPSIFGASTPSLFGGGSAPSFSTGGLFGGTSAGFMGSQPQGPPMGGQPQAQVPSVVAAPYGSFPALPTIPEPKVGISTRPARTIQTTGTSHASPLLSLRGTSGHKLGVQVRAPHVSPLGSAMFGAPARAAPIARPDGGAVPPQPPAPLPVRPNPHRLFIREPPPGTEPAASPAATAGQASTAPWVPPTSPIAVTPFRPSPGAPSFAPPTASTPGLMSPRSPVAAAPAEQAGRGRELSLANGSSQGPVLTEFVREAASEEDGGISRAASGTMPTLGRLATEGYTYEPSPTQLAAMHTLDPRSLHKVHNFTITRPGLGSIRWLRPIDVVGLKLDRIVTIQHGEVFCYTDTEKPSLGNGLNSEAEITLYGVHKTDKATGSHVRDGPQLVKWEKSLRLMCLRMGAKFVSYKPDGGVWRFEVEHFSRYGLLPEVEAEEEAAAAAAAAANMGSNIAGPGFGGTPASRTLQPHTPWGADKQPRFGTMIDEDTDEISLVTRKREDDHMAEQGEAQGPPAEGYACGGTPLQHGLPAGLNLSPASLLALRESFGTDGGSGRYGTVGSSLSPTTEAQLALPNKRAKPTLLGPQPSADMLALPTGVAGAPGRAPRAPASSVSAPAAAARGAPVAHSWRRSAAPVAHPRPGPSTSPAQQATLATRMGEEDEGVERRAGRRGLGVVWDEEEEFGAARFEGARVGAEGGPGLADSGQVMASSFRASWGPGGVLVIPGRGMITGSGTSQPLTIRHISPATHTHSRQHPPPPPLSRPDPLGLVEHAGGEEQQAAAEMDEGEAAGEETAKVRGPAALQRERLRAALEVHLQHSAPVGSTEGLNEGATDEGTDGSNNEVPRWQLRCTRDSLKDFVNALSHALRRSFSMPLGSDQHQGEDWLEAEAVQVAYEIDTWQLLQVLFARLDPGMAPGIQGGSQHSALRTPRRPRSVQGDDDEMAEATPTPVGLGNGPRLNRSTSAMIRASRGTSFSKRSGSDGGCTPSYPDEASAPLLMAALRQGALSRWLQQQAAPRAASALEQGESTGLLEPALHAVLQLMSARQLGAAAAVAAACGDVALSTLVAGTPTHATCQAEVAEQLSAWQASGVLNHVARGRLLIYQLLAGQVSNVSASLNLDWRRHLGLLLWYHIRTTVMPPTFTPAARNSTTITITATATTPTTTPTTTGTSSNPMLLPHQRAPATAAVDALRAYATTLLTQAHSTVGGDAPWPHPLYMEGQQGRTLANAHAPQDLQYVLLQLWRAHCEACAEAEAELEAHAQAGSAEHTPGGESGSAVGVVADQEPVQELLVASSHSAHPCNCGLPWMLSTALQGLGVVRGGAQQQQEGQKLKCGELSWEAAELMLTSHMDLILQVQLAGGMPEWAVYVAMHLPHSSPVWQAAGHKPAPNDQHSLRWHVVQELLMRSAPEWAGDGEKEAFLCDTLGVPTALVAQAVAVWAQHQGDFHTACTALMAARQWQQAHEVLAQHVAPSLMLRRGYDRLEGLLSEMAPHASQLPDWRLRGGLYLYYITTMSSLPSQIKAAVAAAKHGQQDQLHQILDQLMQLSEALAAASAAISMYAQLPHMASTGALAADSLSPHALQQQVVLGEMAGHVKSALLWVAHWQARTHARAHGRTGLLGPDAGLALCSVLGLGSLEQGHAYGHVGTVAWYVGAAIA